LSPRVGYVLQAVSLAFGMAVVAILLLASRPATAQTDPPASGTWDVNDITRWSEPVTLMGDLVVKSGGDLTLSDMELVFWCSERSEFGVRVEGGGRLTARNVVFRANNASFPCRFVLNWNSVVGLDNCTIKYVGSFGQTRDTWGVYVHSPFVNISFCTISQCNVGVLVHGVASSSIYQCNISDNYDRGIWCMYGSPFIGNNRLENNSYGIYLEESPGLALLNNEFIDNRREALAMDANSSVSEWTIDEPTTWVRSTVFLRGNITVRPGGALAMEDSLLRMDSPSGSRKSVLVAPGGSLRLEKSTLEATSGRAGDAYSLAVESGGGLVLEGSAIHGAGYDPLRANLSGPFIGSGALINGSDLTGNLVSLVCQGASVRVSNSSLGGTIADLVLGNSTARLLNVTYRPANVTFSDVSSVLWSGWYLSAGVLWQNGRACAGATLTVRDGQGATLFDGAPGPDGWVRWMEALQFRVQKGEATPLGNVALLAKKAGFSDLRSDIPLAADRDVRLVFTDPAPPTVAITSPGNGYGTNRDWVLLSGTASDDIGLDRVELRLDDSSRWQPLSAGGWSFNLTNLSGGEHRIQVRAIDIAGQAAYVNLSITADFDPPRLELEEPFDEEVLTNETGVRFSGRTDPDANLTIDGILVPVDAGGAFDQVITFTEGYHEVRILARDRGGNAVSATRKISVDLSPPSITVLSPANGTRTRLEELGLVGMVEPGAKFRVDGSTVLLGPDGGFNATVLLSGGRKDIELYAEDRAGNSNTTTWTLVRKMDEPQVEPPMQRYGLALTLAVVLAAVFVAIVALVVVRRKGRAPPPARQVELPALAPRRL